MTDLSRLEAIADQNSVKDVMCRIEAALPIGVRSRQLSVRTLLLGVLICEADHRPAHLTRVHEALCNLPEPKRLFLGVTALWKAGPHRLTYRQTEYTACLVDRVLKKRAPDGRPTRLLQELVDALLEASAPEGKASSSLAVDWTDVESFSTRRTKPDGTYADKEAAWGHRKGGGPGEKDELFFGYYLSLATMVKDEGGEVVPEVVRRMNLVSCDHDPVPEMVEVLSELPDSQIPLGDVIVDSGYSHRVPEHFALPLRAAGASLVMDLHPADRGTKGTFLGATLWNGNLYCPATPPLLFELGPLPRGANEKDIADHDARAAELGRYKLGRVSSDDPDGYHRVTCPAVMGKVRCPLRPASMTLSYSRPEIFEPPEHPAVCCAKVTITVPPEVSSKTAQRHDYPGKAWHRSYARRSAAERSNARIKDPATIDVKRGWCRKMGLVPMSLFICCAIVVRNMAVIDAFDERANDADQRALSGKGPRVRRRRRRSIADLVASANAPP